MRLREWESLGEAKEAPRQIQGDGRKRIARHHAVASIFIGGLRALEKSPEAIWLLERLFGWSK